MTNRIIIEVTTKCNLGCKYCYHNCDSCGNDIYLDLLKEIIKKIKIVKKECQVILTGGEPLCCTDISSILVELKRNDVESIIYTNGLSLSDEMLDHFKNNGVKKIQVSLDGLNEQTNRLRNLTQEMVERIRNNIVKASIYKEFSVDISCVLSYVNYQQIGVLLDFAKENDAGVVFSFLSPEGKASESEMLPDSKHVGETLLKLDKLLPHYNLTMPSCGLGGACPISSGKGLTPYVDYKGDVFPCIGLRGEVFCLGNVMDVGFSFDFSENLILTRLKEILVTRGNLMKDTYCRKCFYHNSSCNGGCLSNSIVEKNNYFIQSDKCAAYDFYGKYKFIKNCFNNK